MKNVNFYIEDSDLARTMQDLDRYEQAKQVQIKRAVGEAALHIEGRAKSHHPWKTRTGRLISSIAASIKNRGFTGIVAARTNYAAGLELGTKPHTISARRAPMLRFQVGGKWVSKKSVSHPGTRAYPFMKPALEHETPRFKKAIMKILNRVA